jgi:hypothetical protein
MNLDSPSLPSLSGKDEIQPNEDLVNPWRLAQGDLVVARNLRGKVCRAIPSTLTIMKELVRRGIFPHHWEIYGVGFLELRNAFRSAQAPRSSAVLMEQWGVGISGGRGNEIYELVARKIGVPRAHIVEAVVERPAVEEVVSAHWQYKNAFELLVEVMDHERERLYQERQRLGE